MHCAELVPKRFVPKPEVYLARSHQVSNQRPARSCRQHESYPKTVSRSEGPISVQMVGRAEVGSYSELGESLNRPEIVLLAQYQVVWA